MDKFQQMRVYAAVAEAGSFVGAARALSMSKAAVSRKVSDLEDRLGVRLLHRTTRRLSLTEAGDIFRERCRALLSEVEAAEAELTARSGHAIGVLKVNVPVTFGIHHLAPLWAEFSASHPALHLDITLSDRIADLVDEGFDLAIRIGRLRDSSLVSRRLSTTRLVPCASPAYLAQHGMPQHPDELAAHRIWGYSYSDTGDDWHLTGPEGPVRVRVKPAVRSNNGDTCRAGALAHQGITLQPTFIVGDDLAAGTLREVLPMYRGRELGIFAVYPSRRHVAPKVRLLVDYLAQHFASHPWPQ